MTVYSK